MILAMRWAGCHVGGSMMSGVLYDYSDALGWVPMWGEYADEVIEDYLEAYGLLVEDLELLKSAYRHDNMNCECVGQRLLVALFSNFSYFFNTSVILKKKKKGNRAMEKHIVTQAESHVWSRRGSNLLPFSPLSLCFV
jgi:hypothetical protein